LVVGASGLAVGGGRIGASDRFGSAQTPAPAPAGWVATDLGPGAATAINSHGQIVGDGCDGCAGRAVLWHAAKKIDLVPPNELSGSYVTGLNDRGQAVGFSYTKAGVLFAFLSQNGRARSLGTLGGKSSTASAINQRGQIIGWSDTKGGAQHAFLWESGRMRDLGTLGGKSSRALGLNEHGDVVGWSDTGAAAHHAFVWTNGRMRDLGALAGFSEAVAINDQRVIVGRRAARTETDGNLGVPAHAFVWQAGKVADLGTLATGDFTSFLGLNQRGQITGTLATGNRTIRGNVVPSSRAFTWQDGRMTTLSVPRGTVASGATGMNESGQIVGWHTFVSNGSSSMYLTLREASLWNHGAMTDLGVLGRQGGRGTNAAALAINGQGVIVGVSGNPGLHAVLWTNGPRRRVSRKLTSPSRPQSVPDAHPAHATKRPTVGSRM
jgi:probable HAF family extracellular repeat protein